ncbi:MAG: AMP-binding protein [Deltaproteobacteria bacterium]|nr:AMP-binding protein [Deltaproteobacteria bacterium]
MQSVESPTSLDAAFHSTATRQAAATALVFDDVSYSYRALRIASERFAHALLAAGIEPGQRVVVGMTNSPELVVSILGTIAAGAILVPVNPAATADELLYIIGDCGARLAVVESAHLGVLRDATPTGLTPLDGPNLGRDCFAATLETSADRRPNAIDPRSPALIIYTSGTTGRPKGAVLSHEALTTNLLTVAEAWRWTANDRLLLTLPCFHLHGLGLGILTSLMVGSSIVLRRRFVVDEVLADLARFECTMFFGVPTMYSRLVALPDTALRTYRRQRMRLWVSGSAPLNAALFERFRERFGYELMDRYGMTECCFVLSTPYDEPRRPGMVGRPLAGVDVRLVDPDAADSGKIVDVADGSHGEILIRGSNLFSGYWQRPQETQRVMLDGYLRSGDIAVREADGMFRIVGRSSVDIIKSRGFKVGAVEIEEALQRHPAVEEVAVVGLPDPDQGERVVAAVILRRDAQVSTDQLRAHVRTLLAPHKVPADIVFVDDIPRIGPGKFKKKELIARLS